MQKKILFPILSLASLSIVALAGQSVYSQWQSSQSEKDLSITTPLPTESQIQATSQPSASPSQPSNQPLPQRINLDVPFTSQAPFAIWDEQSKEACEEASILMAKWYAQDKKGLQQNGYQNQIPPDEVKNETHDLIHWQESTFGYYEDTSVQDTYRMLTEKLGVKSARITTDISSDAFKRELANGNLIIIPVAGKTLNNPYFQGDGPPYHKFVIRGYNEEGFIANEPGIRQGEGHVYPEHTVMEAVHDWTGNDATIHSGKQVAIIVGKES